MCYLTHGHHYVFPCSSFSFPYFVVNCISDTNLVTVSYASIYFFDYCTGFLPSSVVMLLRKNRLYVSLLLSFYYFFQAYFIHIASNRPFYCNSYPEVVVFIDSNVYFDISSWQKTEIIKLIIPRSTYWQTAVTLESIKHICVECTNCFCCSLN